MLVVECEWEGGVSSGVGGCVLVVEWEGGVSSGV